MQIILAVNIQFFNWIRVINSRIKMEEEKWGTIKEKNWYFSSVAGRRDRKIEAAVYRHEFSEHDSPNRPIVDGQHSLAFNTSPIAWDSVDDGSSLSRLAIGFAFAIENTQKQQGS